MSLILAVGDPQRRKEIAADAVHEAEAAVASRSGLLGAGAKLGLETINRLRPTFLEQHVYALLPGWAAALEPYWRNGTATGDLPAHFDDEADSIAADLLEVSDAYVAAASDAKAIAAYMHLRPRAPKRVAEQMPRITAFVERHASEPLTS